MYHYLGSEAYHLKLLSGLNSRPRLSAVVEAGKISLIPTKSLLQLVQTPFSDETFLEHVKTCLAPACHEPRLETKRIQDIKLLQVNSR